MAAENPELACSPDGLVMDPSLSDHQLGKYGLLEVKCPLMLEEKDVKDFDKVLSKKQISQFSLERRDGSMKLKTKHRYYYQVQMRLAVTGLKWCDFVVWSSVDDILDRVHFDHTFWNPPKSN